MRLNEYQQLAQRTSNTITSWDKIVNGLLGLHGEGGELSDLFKKAEYQGHELDYGHMARELGDCLWYVAEIATGIGYTLADIARLNIDKLKARYPAGFTVEKSLHRAEGDC